MGIDTRELEGGMQYTEASRYLREAYDTNFQLDTGPTGIEMTDSEHMTKGSLFEYWLGQYRRFKIGDLWNLNFYEYLDQPRFRIQAMNRIAEQDSKDEVADAEAAARAAQNLLKGAGK